MPKIIRAAGRTDPLGHYTGAVSTPLQISREWLDAAGASTTGCGERIRELVQASVEQQGPDLAGLSDAIFAEPELGLQEHRTVNRIAEYLAHRGVQAEVGAFGLETAFVARKGSSGPHFAILAEYDALPGVGHACGHNLIAAIGIGAFLALVPVVKDLGGQISLIGSPAEENAGAKELIIQAGGFDGVGAAGMVHPTNGDGLTPVAGFTTSGVRRVAVTYRGRAAHAAAAPQLGLNALDAVVLGYQGVAALRQHITAEERIHGIITDGGKAPNVIPAEASALYYVRSASVTGLQVLVDRVTDILEGAALATGTSTEVTLDPVPAYLPLRENVALNLQWAKALPTRQADLLPEGGYLTFSASTDMGNVSELIPSLHPMIGIGAPAEIFPHHPDFAKFTTTSQAHAATVEAATALAITAADWIIDPALRQCAQREFVGRGQ